MFPKQLVNALTVSLDRQRPFFIWGAPGVGKSDIVAQVAKNRGMELRDVRLGLMDPTDIKGFPMPDITAGNMRWLPANFLPPMFIDKKTVTGKGKTAKTTFERVPNDSKGVLFLDEMNQAPPMTQAAAYQLVLNRAVGDYKLPDGWAVIAAGNREGDRGNVQRQPVPLALRFTHVSLEVNHLEWCDWALAADVSYKLTAFIRFRPELLHAFDPTKPSSPNPRSWVMASDYEDMDKSTRMALFAGTVGEAAAGEYAAFLDVFDELPSVDEIKLRPDTTPIPEKPSTRFAITSALAAHSTKELFPRFMQYMGRMDTEWLVAFVTDAMVRHPDVCKTKEFGTFAIKHSVVLG